MEIKNTPETDASKKNSEDFLKTETIFQNPEKSTKKVKRQPTQEELDNPFHGVKLVQVLERLVEHYGWIYLGERTNIRCFIYNPTMKSSLGFLRKTTWAREFVEDVYLEMLDEKEGKQHSDLDS